MDIEGSAPACSRAVARMLAFIWLVTGGGRTGRARGPFVDDVLCGMGLSGPEDQEGRKRFYIVFRHLAVKLKKDFGVKLRIAADPADAARRGAVVRARRVFVDDYGILSPRALAALFAAHPGFFREQAGMIREECRRNTSR